MIPATHLPPDHPDPLTTRPLHLVRLVELFRFFQFLGLEWAFLGIFPQERLRRQMPLRFLQEFLDCERA